MASPFSVFRKNQKVLMALLVGFSMIAFIVADSINATNFPIFLGAILGSLALWLLSGKGGSEGWLIAAVGGVIGAIVGVYGPSLIGDNTAVYTAQGNLSHEEVERIARRQDQANQFLSMAVATARENLPEAEQMRLPQPRPFDFFRSGDAANYRENAVLTFLFQKEAEELGIELTDDAVEKFIIDVTGGKLTDADLRQIRNDMQIGTGQLIDVLREQLLARQAYELLQPYVTSPTPQKLWTNFAKLSTEAEVTTVAVRAESFLAEVEDPSEEDLTRFFDQYKTVPPSADGTPGFLVPRQVQLAYLEVDFEEAQKAATPPNDEEVLAVYQRNQAPFESPPSRPPGSTPPTGASADESAEDGSTDEPATPVEAPRGTAPATGENASPTGESNAPAVPQTPEKPADDAETPAPTEASDPQPDGEQGAFLDRGDLEFVAFQDEPQPTDATAPADSTPADSTPADSTPADSAPADEASPPPSTDPPAFPAPGTPGADQTPAQPSQETLDAIREDLLNQRAREIADAKTEEALDDMYGLVTRIMDAVPLPEDSQDEAQQRKYDEDRRAAAKKVVAEMEAYAKKNGLSFKTTPYFSPQELYDSDDYPIGRAVRWERNAPVFGRETTPVADTIFQMSPDQPLSPIAAQSMLNENRYIALKIADVPPRVPTLGEETVRERVVKSWKLREARELAKDRAERIVKKAVNAKSDVAEAIKGETLTGKKGGQTLTARQVGPFTWLRRTTAPSADFSLPDIVPTTLPQLPGAGEEFMRTVFQQLDVNESEVIPAADGSAFYVVELDRREPASGLANARQDFLREDFFRHPLDAIYPIPANPFRRRTMMEAAETRGQWLEAFRQRHEVVDPAAPPRPAA